LFDPRSSKAGTKSNETVLNGEGVVVQTSSAKLAPDPPVINKTRTIPAEIDRPRTICRVSATADLNELGT